MNAIYAHCDAALATGPASARETRHSNWLLTTTILASSLAFLNGSVVNIGLPSVGGTFKASPGDLQWVINAYLLPLSALLLLGGRGRRSVRARAPSYYRDCDIRGCFDRLRARTKPAMVAGRA